MTSQGKFVSNSNVALERLRALIGEGGLAPESQLPPERVLAERFGVGRRAVRRALEVLEAEGRIWRRQGSGTFVGREPAPRERGPGDGGLVAHDGTNVFEVMEVRLRLEPALAHLAALRAVPDDIRQMHSILERLRGAADDDSRELWDSALHRLIAETAGNALFLKLFDMVDRFRQDQAWRNIRRLARGGGRVSVFSAHHSAIVAAIEERDPVAAESAMRRHILSLQEHLFSVMAGALSHAS